MKLLVVTDPGRRQDEAAELRALFEAGLERLHLRKPGWETAEVRSLLSAIDAAYRTRVVLHGAHELADEFAVAGVHLTEARRKSGAESERAVSAAFHDPLDLASCGARFEYALFGPVFASISKPGRAQSLSAEALARVAAAPGVNVAAVGGVKAERIGALRELGFWGAACCGALWSSEERRGRSVVEVFRELREVCLD